MAERSNYIIGYGERLNSDIAAPAGGAPKQHAYSLHEAQDRLAPRVSSAIAALDKLPDVVCPNDETVALMTLHPSYLAKSYYPSDLLKSFGLEAVGSRSREVKPEKWAKKSPPESAITSELFIAGKRENFRRFATTIKTMRIESAGASDLIKVEDFRVQKAAERLKPLRSRDKDPLLEIVLHAQPLKQDDFILQGFEEYLAALGIELDLDDRRFYAEGLCFLSVRAPRAALPDIAKYSFLRVAREMPRLRQFRPVTRATQGFASFDCRLPKKDALNTDIRVAVFDGGIKSDAGLDRWVTRKRTKNIGDPVPEFQNHGTAVTSALLFGPLRDGIAASQPYANVDHYRVLDVDTMNDDQSELYSVLERIEDVIVSRPKYDFINLSLGPDLPIEDDDVHAWTAVLDQHFSDGLTLPAIAVGNSGENDWASGNARIQTPADCVNALSIGGCDRTGPDWKRAPYSSIGPGRSPGIIKPDGLAFGGSTLEPYWVLNAEEPGEAMPLTGTSFAAPTALRTGIGLKAHFGTLLNPLAIKALLIHSADSGEHDRAEVGWGRIPEDMNEIVRTQDHAAHIVYQGELRPASWVRIPIPIPTEPLKGMVDITATFCFATPTDPQDPLNYTRSGLEVRFRPHDGKRKDPSQANPDSKPFFQVGDMPTEADLRSDAHKWETTMHKHRSMRAGGLRNPTFDVHYNARIGGRNSVGASKIPYALIVTVEAKQVADLYNKILQRYPTILEPLRPVVSIPVRT